MKARELRIGNFILDYGIVIEANGFLLTRLEEINGEGKIAINTSPIPLTEEWLVKFGFEKIESGYSAVKYLGYDFVLFDGDFEIAVFEDGFYYNTAYHNVKLEYVHQLQNLYFALTGEELTIK